MPRIRWRNNGPDNEWRGYLGKAKICAINWQNDMFFFPLYDWHPYSKLSSAKRGAERMLQKFLYEAGLEVKEITKEEANG